MQNLFDDKLVNKEKLIDLLNDSFGKSLDVCPYLDRINKNIATVVIVGDYDGAAIITWEYSKGERLPILISLPSPKRIKVYLA